MHTTNTYKSTCFSDKRQLLPSPCTRTAPAGPRHGLANNHHISAPQHSNREDLFDQNLSQTICRSRSAASEQAEDRRHIGVNPDQPDSPLPEPPNKAQGVVLVLAVAVGVALWAVTFWRQLTSFPPPKPSQQKPRNYTLPPDQPSRRRRKRPSSPKPATPHSSNIICRNFAAKGSCRFGDKCRYKHVFVPESERASVALHSASPLTTDDYDSTAESDSEDSFTGSSGPSRIPAPALAKYMDQMSNPYQPSPLQTLKRTYLVPAEQASNVGRLMGFGGRRIRQITQDTGCCIIVAKDVAPGEQVPIDIHAEKEEDSLEALRLITDCFEGIKEPTKAPEDSLSDADNVDAYDSEPDSDSDLDESSSVSSEPSSQRSRKRTTESSPLPSQKMQGQYLVPAELAQDMGRLMGKGGRKITGITYVTGCTISVPKERPPGEAVPVTVYGDDESSISEALELIAKCFC